MKILFITMAHPAKKSGPNTFVKNLIAQLQKMKKLEMIWVVCEKNKIENEKMENGVIFDIRDFDNAVDMLDSIQPDCVLGINNKFIPLQNAISNASKFKKIPLIHFKVIEKIEESINNEVKKLPKTTLQNMKKFLVDDNGEETALFKKGSFVLYKHNFLYKTRSKIGIGFKNNFLLLINDISSYFWKKERMYAVADLQLVNNVSWKEYFKKIGFGEEKLALTGSPYWDPIYEKIRNRDVEKINLDDRQLKILIITSPLVEHGYGTYSDRDLFLKNIFLELESHEFNIDIKIHPSSETKKSYEEFLLKNNLQIKIFQKETLWDIIQDYDLIITYGYGYPQIECAFGGIRTILLKTKWEFPIIPIVKEAMNSGYFRLCEKVEDTIPTINELVNEKVEISEKIKVERGNLSYKFDGKAGERAATAIFDLLKNFGK